jgi:hypothetical protein
MTSGWEENNTHKKREADGNEGCPCGLELLENLLKSNKKEEKMMMMMMMMMLLSDKETKGWEFLFFSFHTSGHNLNATSPPDSAIKINTLIDQRKGLRKHSKAVSTTERII